jgi:hypothetical protein
MSNPTSINFTVPWHAMPDGPSHRDGLLAELHRELVSPHPLFGLPAVPIARRQACDDVLFRFGHLPERYAVVRLTWTGKPERAPQFPWTEIFDSLDDFAATRMKEDAFDFEQSA